MKEWKTIFHASRNKKKTDKIDFNPKNSNKIQRKSLYNDKGVNWSRRYNNHKYIHTQHQDTTYIFLNDNEPEGRNRQ